MDLNDLHMVAVIAHWGQLQAAAKALGVSHATVFRRLDALEKRLGQSLFTRSGGRYVATLGGEALATAGETMVHEAQAAWRKLTDHELQASGVVRITSSEAMAAHLLPHVFARCQHAHAGIKLRISHDKHYLDLSRREADIALRATTEPPPDLIGKRVGSMAFAAYATPTIAKQCKPRDHAQWPWLALDESLSAHPSLRWLAQHTALDALVLRSDSFTVLAQACASGVGAAVLPCFMGDAHPQLQRLTPVLPGCETELWLLTHPELRHVVRVQTVVGVMLDALGELRGALAGRG